MNDIYRSNVLQINSLDRLFHKKHHNDVVVVEMSISRLFIYKYTFLNFANKIVSEVDCSPVDHFFVVLDLSEILDPEIMKSK
jgi:hypothetical protein